ncbi:MAG: hypothetical protein QM779_08825 [Propionicimonas sp.]|uniref:hypothetical protein n=1 Tax=Propionicimonas sp. TaxID=1955623 RepID=UPI003D0A9418
MSNRTGTAYALTTIARINDDAEDDLEDYLAALPRGKDSPLARVGGLHLSRLHIIRRLVHQGPMQRHRDTLRHAHLVFTATFNGELGDFLAELAAKVPECDEWWGRCVRYPGRADQAAFDDYVASIQVETTLFQSPIPTTTVSEVRDAVAIRERVIDFAVSTQGLDAAALRQRFSEVF